MNNKYTFYGVTFGHHSYGNFAWFQLVLIRVFDWQNKSCSRTATCDINFTLKFTLLERRKEEDYDEEVEEDLQDEVSS